MQTNKRAAIELSIGTIVIVVLAMSMLIMGIVLVRTIFTSTQSSVTEIDKGVKNEINKLFNSNKDRKLVLYPDSGIIELEQGSKGAGFAIAIRNIDDVNEHDYSYDVVQDSATDCGGSFDTNDLRITAGESSSGVPLAPGNMMENPIHVRFLVGESAPTCVVRYKITVEEDGNAYQTDFMDVEIVRK